MNNVNFKIVRRGQEVTIVRIKNAVKEKGSSPIQGMKVMCFEAAWIDRIFGLQEQNEKIH